MKNAPRHILALVVLLVGFAVAAQAKMNVAPVAPVSLRDAVADALSLARMHDGAKVMKIAGVSMLPYFGEGALVVVKPISEAKLRAGMVVVYRNRFDETIAHRLIAREAAGWVAQGFNNEAADSTLVNAENLVGVVYATFHTMARTATGTQLSVSPVTLEVALAAPAK